MRVLNSVNFIIPAILVILVQTVVFAQSYPTYNTERPYTLRSLDYAPLLNRFHDITTGSAEQSFFYPRIDSTFRTPGNRYELNVRPMLAFDMRGGKALGDTIMAFEGGLHLSGYIDSAEFWLDARIFSESHSAKPPKSWDREFLENQGNKDIEGEVEYSSYARYRGHFAMRFGWAVLDFGRDAQHWGPGYYNNLSLNQGSVPYNQIALTTKIGYLSVRSLYADLDAGKNSMGKKASRNLYGHRYELNFENLTLGVSEITILYDLNHYFLFVPIVPLFAEKGNYSEDNNNGTISFDINYRFPFGLRIYGEYLLDDMESPTSLFRNDNIEAKWAGMAGAAYAMNFRDWKIGGIAEYARVEPYTYSHFHPNTAQVAHLDYPLGVQSGPNSQNIDLVIYGTHAKHFTAQVKQEWSWKGSDYGSAINDTTPTSGHYKTAKRFLRNADGSRAKMEYTLTPAVAWMSKHYAISAEYSLFDKNAFCSRIMFMW